MADSDDGLSWQQLVGGVAALAAAIVLCGGLGTWCAGKLLVIKEVGTDWEYVLRGPDGAKIDPDETDRVDAYPVLIEFDLGTTYGGEPSRTVDGEMTVNPEQNCELAKPVECEDGTCEASVRVTGPGMCAYGIQLESARGGGVHTCSWTIFAPTPDEYASYEKQWEEKDGGRYVQGVQAEAHERCWD